MEDDIEEHNTDLMRNVIELFDVGYVSSFFSSLSSPGKHPFLLIIVSLEFCWRLHSETESCSKLEMSQDWRSLWMVVPRPGFHSIPSEFVGDRGLS